MLDLQATRSLVYPRSTTSSRSTDCSPITHRVHSSLRSPAGLSYLTLGKLSSAHVCTMFAKDFLADDEREVDTELGYPRGYAKLCRHAYIQMQGLITPFTEGPPQRFHPYAPLDEELAKLKEIDALFPIIDEAERDPSNARRHAGFLWQQLDHLGNAGFDPAKFRVDAYGNVIYWNADPGSPLAWEVDHWFPHSRGGKTVLSNLRIVQWQVNQRKSTKLEFLIPWWDLQMGVSVNQFLSVFSSKNADFRQRAFALFFLGGENEQLDENLVVECHSWPQPFRDRKHQLGLAAAALVKVQRHMDDTLKVLNSNRAPKQNLQQIAGAVTPARRRWTSDEEDALKRALQKFGPGNWKEIKEFEPMLVNRSTVQIKDKYRLMRGEWDKENKDIPSDQYMASMQREEQIKQARAEEIKQKEEELFQLEEELRLIKDHNEKEKIILEELEQSLGKQRKRVEKQRKWSETQSQYRLCLEKMIRDTMHQCVLFKEQARLNQAACNALLARLESQKSACDSAEMDLMRRVKQRESLEASARPKISKRTRKAGHTDVGGCMKLNAGASKLDKDKTHGWAHKVGLSAEMDRLKDHKMHTVRRARVPDSPEQDAQDSEEPGCQTPSSKSPDQDQDISHGDVDDLDADRLHTYKSMPMRAQESLPSAKAGNDDVLQKIKASDLLMERNDSNQHQENNGLDCRSQEGPSMIQKAASPTGSSESAGVKRKAVDPSDLDVALLRHEYEEDNAGRKHESVGDKNSSECDHAHNAATLKPLDRPKTKDDEQLDELLQEVLEMRGKVDAAMADAIEDEEDEEDRVKRVGKLNLDKWLQMLLLPGKDADNSEFAAQIKPHTKTHFSKPQESLDAEESTRGGMIGDFFKKLSFKHGQADAERLNSAAEEPNLRVPNRGDTVKGTKELKAEENGQAIIRRHANAGPRHCVAGPSIKQVTTVNAHAAPLQGKCSKTPCNDEGLKTEERKVIESFSRLKLSSNADVRPTASMTDGSTENSEVAFQITCETEFVEKMRATRERELRRKRQANAGVPPKLQDLLEDSSQEPSQEQHLQWGESSVGMTMPSPSPTKATVQKSSPAKVKLDEQRRRSMGGSMKEQNQFTFPRQQHQLAMTPILKRPQQHQQQSFERAKQSSKHPQQSVRNPQCSSPCLELQSQPLERSSSTPPAQFRHTPSTPPPQFTHRRKTGELPHHQQPTSQVPQLSRQMTTGHAGASGGVVNSGGAARKASMLMKSASTRGTSGAGGRTSSSSGSVSSPARSSSSGGAGRRGGEGEAEVASLRRKASFFQDWDGANEGLRASLSHVWKKAVKKFDLARQQQAHS